MTIPEPVIAKGYDVTDAAKKDGLTKEGLLAITDQTPDYTPTHNDGRQEISNQELLAGVNGQPCEKIEIISAFDIVKQDPQTEPLIENFLNKGDPLIIHSPGGVGKSLFTQNLTVQCAMESPGLLFDAFKIKAEQMISLFIQSENSSATINARLRGMVGNDSESWDILKRLYFPKINDDILTTGRNFADPIFIYYCIDLIKKIEDQAGQSPGLLVVDPLISYLLGDENDSQSMRTCLDGLTEIAQQTGVTPIVVTHDNKNNGYRGSSASYDWARNVIGLKRVFIGEDRIIDFNNGTPVKRIAQIPAIEVISEKSNNMRAFEKFTIVMDHRFRFSMVGDAIPPEVRERCMEVQQALKDIGGFAESNNKLAKAVSELTGRSVNTCKTAIAKAVENGFIAAEKPQGGNTHAYCYAVNK